MKKVLLLVLVVVIFTSSFVSCNKNSSTETSKNKTSSNTSKKLTIWSWDPNFNIAIMKEAKKIYLKSHKDVKIELVDIAKGDLEQKLHTVLASGVKDQLPDIVLIEDYNAQKYIQAYPGAFVDLTNKIQYKDFANYKVKLMTFENKIYGIPFDSGVGGFFYRTDYLKQAGYEDSALKDITWDDFIKIGKDVKAKTKKSMLGLTLNDGGIMRMMLQSAGKWYFDDKSNIDLANNKALIEALDTHKKIVDSGIIKETNGWEGWVKSFNSGDVASVVSGVWIIASIKAEKSQAGKWKVTSVPRMSGSGSVNSTNLGGSSWYVLNGTKSKDLAVDFFNSVYTKDIEFYQKILVDRGAVGTYLPAQSGSAYTQADSYFSDQKVFSDFTKWMEKIPPINYGTYTYEADSAIMAVMPDFYAGKLTAKEALKKAESQLKNQIKK